MHGPPPLPSPESMNRSAREPKRTAAAEPPPTSSREPVAGGGNGAEIANPAALPPLSAAGTVSAASQAPADERGERLSEIALRRAPPWLASSIVHMLLVLVLGLWVLSSPRSPRVELTMLIDDELGEQLDEEPVRLEMPQPEELDAVTVESPLPEVIDPFAAPPEVEVALDAEFATSDIAVPAIGTALDGRQEGSREALLRKYGGTPASEDAVLEALRWLARQQQRDGSWSLTGPYTDGANVENRMAATAMALLAFLGHGETHQKPGMFQETVQRGLKALLAGQSKETGSFYDEASGRSSHRFYTHGQATIAICELWAMTRDETLSSPAQRAVDYCVESQDPGRGGWRYRPRNDSDTSVTGWIVMALQSARMGGLSVPPETLDRVTGYLDRASEERGSRYGYTPGAAPSKIMTAEGLLCRQYLGWNQDDERLLSGVDYLLLEENLPSWEERDRNVYYWYYATQVLHHMEGEPWEKWNPLMRDLIVEHQVPNGRERGSWEPLLPAADRWGHHGGRLYVTCLSVYILEVYYRHLPIYSTQFGRPS